jgi:hypothetical protein
MVRVKFRFWHKGQFDSGAWALLESMKENVLDKRIVFYYASAFETMPKRVNHSRNIPPSIISGRIMNMRPCLDFNHWMFLLKEETIHRFIAPFGPFRAGEM